MKKKWIAAMMCLFMMAGCAQQKPDDPTDDPTPDTPEITYTYYETDGGVEMAPVYDLGLLSVEDFNESKIKGQMRVLKQMGFTRIYVVTQNAGSPMYSSQTNAPTPYTHVLNNVNNLGDVNAAFAKACLDLGLEPYAVFKPYENGGGYTIPEGVTVSSATVYDKTVGGSRLYFDTFTAQNLDKRVVRKDDYNANDYTDTVDKIEIQFVMDSVTTHNEGKEQTLNKVGQAKPNICIWVSKDNEAYSVYTGTYSVNYSLDKRVLLDSNGNELENGEKKNCNILSVTGLNIGAEYPYVAVSLENSASMRTIPYSMIKLFSGSREVATTVTTWVRAVNSGATAENWYENQSQPVLATGIKSIVNKNGTPTCNATPNSEILNFVKYGFEFNWRGAGSGGEGYSGSCLYGIARGKSQYMQGTLCEAYSEVREFWLSEVQSLIDGGYRGVDVRLSAHSSMICDYENYGYNEPIARRYQELYGEKIEACTDFTRIMKIRGDYFTLFLQDASELLHQNQCKLQIHLFASDETSQSLAYNNQLCHWTMPKIAVNWKTCVELADEITLKEYYYGAYSAGNAAEIKDYAHSLNKKLWVHCFIQQGDGFTEDYIHQIEQDKRVTGVILYEINFRGTLIQDTTATLKALGFGEQ